MQIFGFERILVVNNESQTIITDDGQRFSASDYKYGERKFTQRQENFYQNLLQIYRITQEKHFLVAFSDSDGNRWRLDKGCIDMAVHNGFLKPLENDSNNVVSWVEFNW